MAEQAFLPIGAHCVFIRNENGKKEVLLMRRFNTGWNDGLWNLPSGRLDVFETPSEGSFREALEECGLFANEYSDVHVLFETHSHEIGGVRKDSTHFFFLIERFEGVPFNAEPHKCDDLRWFELDNLPENTIPKVLVGIRNVVSGKKYEEFKN